MKASGSGGRISRLLLHHLLHSFLHYRQTSFGTSKSGTEALPIPSSNCSDYYPDSSSQSSADALASSAPNNSDTGAMNLVGARRIGK